MSSSSTETLVDVTMPQMGVSVAEGTVVEWKKQVGDWVEADEIIASISTDKIDTDVESPASGRVQEILVDGRRDRRRRHRAGADRHRRASPGEAHVSENAAGRHRRGRGRARGARRGRRAAGRHDGEHAGTAQRRRGAPARRRYSPVVMRIAAEHDIDLEQVEGTGRGGRVRKQDVLAFLEGDGAARPKSRRCTSRARTGPTSRRRRSRASRASARSTSRRAAGRRRPAASRSRACASRSAGA